MRELMELAIRLILLGLIIVLDFKIWELQERVKKLEKEGSYFDRVENIKIGGTD